MKRDMELVRKILIEVEKHGAELVIDGYDDPQIGFHVRLMGEAGLLEVFDNTSYDFPGGVRTAQARGITWDGYEFLELSRDNGIWAKAKEELLKKGIGLPFDIIKLVLTTLTKTMVGV